MEPQIKREIERLKLLNDIYREENEKLKLEYRILYDAYQREVMEVRTHYNQLLDKPFIKIARKIKSHLKGKQDQ